MAAVESGFLEVLAKMIKGRIDDFHATKVNLHDFINGLIVVIDEDDIGSFSVFKDSLNLKLYFGDEVRTEKFEVNLEGFTLDEHLNPVYRVFVFSTDAVETAGLEIIDLNIHSDGSYSGDYTVETDPPKLSKEQWDLLVLEIN